MDRCWGEIQQKGFKLAVFKSRVPNWTSDIVSDCLHTVGRCVLTNYKYTLMTALIGWWTLSLSLQVLPTNEDGPDTGFSWSPGEWSSFSKVQTWFSCIILEHLLIIFCLHCRLDMGHMWLISIFQRIQHILLKKKL